MSSRRPSVFDSLVRAREALARAVATGADPWRVAELRQREQELTDRAAEAGPDVALASTGPAARRPEPAFPLEWVDESAPRGRRNPGATS